MINVFGIDKWAIVTDATARFSLVFVGAINELTADLPYLICDDTEDGVVAKVYVDPVKVEIDGELVWDLSTLTPKDSASIIAQAEV